MSEKSSLLNDDELNQKRKNERFAYILGIFTQLVWAINGLQLKTIQPKFPEPYSLNSIIPSTIKFINSFPALYNFSFSSRIIL